MVASSRLLMLVGCVSASVVLAASPDDRARALLAKMTMDEKLAMLHGYSGDYVGNIPGNDRLGIPPINMNDGPQGFRDNASPGTTTAFPSGLTIAASWDVDAVYRWGEGMGKEFYAKGSNVQLGPGLCLARVPRNGRNFEYISGEDPFLGYTLVQPAIKGIQDQNVVANAKHYIMNNQETNRVGVSENVDETTRYTMYYPPFAGAIKADVGSIMCSYNKINGVWSCENPETLGKDLKQVLGFKGYVMSDWGATHSTSIMQGLDVEMPGNGFMNKTAIEAGISAGTITKEAVDDSVFRILRPMFAVGVMDQPKGTWNSSNVKKNVTTQASVDLVRDLSAQSTVLLKNDGGILPLSKSSSVALIGFASDNAVVHGGGSGSVVPSYISTPLAAFRAAGVSVTYNDGTDLKAAAAAASAADVAIVFVGTVSSEGGDRASLSLNDGCGGCPGNNNNQVNMVTSVLAANKKTVVVASVPGAILLPFSQDVPAILTNFMPGQQAGNAILDVLYGTVNPSARLPLTFPNMENETQLTPAQWPGLPDPSNPQYANYTEKEYVGYRYYEAHGIKFTTGFPFGHGLSYTSFKYALKSSHVEAEKVAIEVTVANDGKVAGAEVAQAYVIFPKSSGAIQTIQLKSFAKTKVLQPGESATVSLDIDRDMLRIWDDKAHAWWPVAGEFQVKIGASSRDFRIEHSVTI